MPQRKSLKSIDPREPEVFQKIIEKFKQIRIGYIYAFKAFWFEDLVYHCTAMSLLC